jgi:aminopeptidase N
VRPDTYARIDNLYTATVYEKGAELIRMLRLIVGDEAFFAGMNRYFDTFDGAAATIEDFIASFQPSTDQDLSAFALWYAQAGTPAITAKEYDAAARTWKRRFAQSRRRRASLQGRRPDPVADRPFDSNGSASKRVGGLSRRTSTCCCDHTAKDFAFTGVVPPRAS